ncbi:MAG: polysaccharide biosynthesis protein [Holosporales bacterium]|jgi:O-antigen biosynthesis protein WbqV|nr:polysaccharide biosynthesis protein [Holosporales bacterium]
MHEKKVFASFSRWVSRCRVILSDCIVALVAFPMALYIRLDQEVTSYPITFFFVSSSLFCFLATIIGFFFNVHKTVWRHVSLPDVTQILKTATFSVCVFFLSIFLIFPDISLPRSTPIIHWCIFAGLLSGTRLGYRIIAEGYSRRRNLQHGCGKPVLLMHTGYEAELFLRYQQQDGKSPYRIVGILDQDHHHTDRTIRGIRVLGPLEDLQSILPALPEFPEQLIVTSDEVPYWPLQKIVAMVEVLGIRVVRLPLMQTNKPFEGTIVASPIAIEDLLGRAEQTLDPSTVENLLREKCILITGAGGSIGSELTRQIASFSPRKLLLFDHSEFLLYSLDKELSSFLTDKTCKRIEKVPLIGDVRDQVYVRHIIATHKPDIVFHAAALKHVPLVESNPEEGVLTNVLGVRHVADVCHMCGVPIMVQVSTDKVVLPKSVMGATKKLAELYCQALDVVSSTQFVTIRFGNVLGSSGSVVPLFEEQIAHGGPITITHADMMRYFMTIPEAVKLILVSAAIRKKSLAQTGQIFVLDMGAPVRIVDLANQIIRLKGLTPGKDIKIVYTGMREGEKLYERLFDDQETLMPSGFQGMHLASSSHLASLDTLRPLFDELTSLAQTRSSQAVSVRIMEIIALLRKTS